ncbi:capsular biosynthesis protein [Burkholderia sp. JP2-270]|uniref:capsular polysaccharide biosynthesis protein n=1 Tax=Burkholderia sp. JP2-270 TaxID=2217913 RepID=UPI000DA2BAA9|nr:capsular biosynthesis protein [Burkholderia sp. JP2-270]AWU98153.1 capsular biosynthesis protein [Burkholderia sp. JP2-270]
MSDSPRESGHTWTLKLHEITPGRRTLSWLLGKSPYHWVDRRMAGTLVQRLARTSSPKTLAAWPGPVASCRDWGIPPLSWFAAPLTTHDAMRSLTDSMNNMLLTAQSGCQTPDILSLMQRVLETDALHPANQLTVPQRIFESHSPRSRVVLVDERSHSATNPGSPERARRRAFRAMLQNARSAHPDAEFWLARSSDPGSGAWLSSDTALPSDIRRLHEPYSLREVLSAADHLYVVGASEGVGGLLADVPTHVFGKPYYAGWGLTHDALEFPERMARPTLPAFFDVAFLRHVRYLDPATHQPGTLASVLESVELQRSVASRFSRLKCVAALRFQWWKRPFATPYLTAGGGSLRWTDLPRQLRPDEQAVVWGGRDATEIPSGVQVVRIEDGFLHSIGLGSDMMAPCSQVIDHQGLYFDASRPNDLTAILNDTTFDAAELTRATALRTLIAELGLTKYNLGRRAPTWQAPGGKRVVLVPGQVADDASIRLGTQAINTVEMLLQEVRRLRPDAFVVYKPHPDVLSGNRNGLIDAARFADIVDADADLISLIEHADEVHTLSSLSGFEALLRGKAVFTYGLPFYAGWGLTHDALAPLPWRERTLSLDMLTAGALLRYPLYWDWHLRRFTTPEAICRQIAKAAGRPLEQVRGNRVRPLLKAIRWTRNALIHFHWRCRQHFQRM